MTAEGVGGLPEYICRIARAVRRTGKTTSQAVAIAVSRVKKWAAGADDVNADTRAKAAKALAQWEAKKAKNKAKSKGRSDRVSASNVLALANAEYNLDIVKQAFSARQREIRKDWREANPGKYPYEDGPQELYVREQWNTFLVACHGYGDERCYYKVPYTVAEDQSVTFGEPVEVKSQYVEVAPADIGDDEGLSDKDLQKMMEMCGPCPQSAAEKILALAAPDAGALDRFLRAAGQ